ncbi:MAG: phosphoserine transaminase [Alphaproteobacteria bacterium]|nr:phosphoserine transaminase [Alphaproteobacteria bacterium]
MYSKPTLKPNCPNFGSGPTKKHPGWHIEELSNALVGRSHRSIQGKERLRQVIDLTRSVLGVPKDYRIGILPGSATCAVECALWSLLGARNVDVMSFDVFGKVWLIDILEELKLENARSLGADFGDLPDLKAYNPDRDLVFTWNGTTSGTCIPNGDWIPENRKGLTICDATSAAFCVELPWEKLDVTAYSWQKGLGGEAAHGILILSPRAVERLESYTPTWPIPRLFRLTYKGKLIENIFKGDTINTPSMLCVEDCLHALTWAESIGGLSALVKRCKDNFGVIKKWVERTSWVEFMASSDLVTSPVSVCLVLPSLKDKEEKSSRDFLQSMATLLRQQAVAFDFVNHAYSPPSLRVWCGPTVEKADLEAFLPWLDWAYASFQNLLQDLP